MIERVFNERYRLDGPLGRGGMATVYAGTDTVLRRRVAIKVLRAELAADRDLVERFYTEAQHSAKLAHPNIVNAYDVGKAGDDYYIVMEFVDGTTLAEMIESDGKLPEPVAIDYAAQICNGLAYAHRQGILHRDIKPANVLVTKDDVCKISDFGIARAASAHAIALTAPGMVMGSVYYVSPEQAQGLELTPASDLYSLGVVIYQMLTGKLPYTGETPVTVALKHVSSPVPHIEADDPTISPALSAIVRKLLQKSPANRFRSAAEVGTALREARERPLEIAGASSIAASALPLDDPETPPPRRRKAAAAGAAPAPASLSARALFAGLAAAIVILGAAGYWFFARGRSTAPMAAVVGMPIDAARSRLEADGAIVRVSERPSESVDKDVVIAQDPAAEALAPRGATVYLVVSSGLPSVALGDLRRFSRDDAERTLRDQKLVPKVIEIFDKAPKGTVVDQSPKSGAALPLHGTVTISVSKGLQPVNVPDVIGQPFAKASAALRAAGLAIEVSERAASSSIAPDTVISQDPKGGVAVEAGTAIAIVISTGSVASAIPDVTTQSIDDASRSIAASGFVPTIVYVVQSGKPNGVVVDQKPEGGTRAPHDSGVTLTVAVSGSVPDVAGLSLESAKRALSDAGYRIGNIAYTQKGEEGAAAYTEPAAASTLRPGEAVTIYFNAGAGR